MTQGQTPVSCWLVAASLVHARAPSVEMTEADRQADVHGETVFAAVTSS